MASTSDHRAHAALQPADCLILLPQRLPAAVETSIGPAHYPAECTQSDAFLQPSLRARNGRANSNSFPAKEADGFTLEIPPGISLSGRVIFRLPKPRNAAGAAAPVNPDEPAPSEDGDDI